jgi:hypothetical protein
MHFDEVAMVPARIPETLPLELGFDFVQPDALDFMQFPGMNFNIPATGQTTGTEIPEGYPASQDLEVDVEDISDYQLGLDYFRLPPHEILLQLVDIFFENLSHMFPCFHKTSFLTEVRIGKTETEAPLLLYAICCVAARYHFDDSVKKHAKHWYEHAKFSYELTKRKPNPALRTVQAVLLLVFHAQTIGDFSTSWLFLGKAWRQAVALGINRIDASDAITKDPTHAVSDDGEEKVCESGKNERKTTVNREEYRRALWLLFIQDRAHAWPTGWPNAILEIQFKADIPIPDSLFQTMDPQTDKSPYKNISFTPNLNRLIASSSLAKDPLNVLQYIAIAHVLLGRVTELVHSLHNVPNTPEYAEDCAELDALIVKFRLTLPRQTISVLEAPPADRGHVIWLQVTLDTMSILLHYRCSKDVPVSDHASQFTLAVIAARNTAQMVKDASRISIDLLLSAHIGSSLYVAACVLIIQWRLTGEDSLKDAIDLLGLVFERMDEVFGFLGLKFKLALEHDLKRSEEDLQSLRERGFRGLLADCTKWEHVKQEVQRRGLDIDLS